MEIYTLQLSKWRLAKKHNIPYIDTTVKSGDPTFAPTWDIVLGIKKKEITEEEYLESYRQLMRETFLSNRSRWDEVADMELVALCCYCPDGCFCHRYEMVKMFEAFCATTNRPFKYLGELIS